MKNAEQLKALVKELRELQDVEMYVVLSGWGVKAQGSIVNISPKGWVRTSNAEGNEEVIHITEIKEVSY
jgi:hypothetical protein